MSTQYDDELKALLDEEDEYMRQDKAFYLECMNNKTLASRVNTADDVQRSGLILFHHVYKKCKGFTDYRIEVTS